MEIITDSTLEDVYKPFIFGSLGLKNTYLPIDDDDFVPKVYYKDTPIHYGAGYMKIPLGGLVTLFMGKGELLGHSGSTGSFAFYHPTSDLFFVGDVNQMATPAVPVRLAMRLAMTIE